MTEMMMTRRGLLLGAGALGLTACNNGVGSNGGAQIDARVDATQSFLFSRYPGTQDLANRANGVLYMPLMTEAGFGIGGAFGRGALRIGGATVDYYSAAKGTSGEIRYATPEQGASIGKETTELDPVIALVFGQQGLIAGATLGGVKYTRIIP
jgi:lipid-binding SYLF domain-containing protein